MKRLVIAYTFLFLTFLSFSQKTDASFIERIDRDTSYRVAGLRYTIFSSPLNTLQSLLTSTDFARLDEYANSFEWYIKTVRPNSHWEGSTSFGFHSRLTSNKQALNQASLIGFTANFETGYNLTKEKMFTVKPIFGIGFEYYKLSFVENFQSSSLSSFANSDFKNYSATSFQVPWTFGLEMGTSFQLKKILIELLLRGGYKLHLDADKWKIDGVLEISDEINLSSPFAGLSVGFSLLERRQIVYLKP
ncbi:MAG: hypothetical protein ACJA1A_000759 [Saprospiraceae bacterium]|jgi:hypothetical protein